MLSTRREPREHSVGRAPSSIGGWGRPLAPLERPSAARRPQHFQTSCTDSTSVLSESRCGPASQPVRPLQGLPEANPTAARSCDCTAVSTHWLPPRAPAPSFSLRSTPPPRCASARRYRPMSCHFIDALPPLSSSPHLEEGGEVLTGQMSSEAPVPSPITEKGTRPVELSSQ